MSLLEYETQRRLPQNIFKENSKKTRNRIEIKKYELFNNIYLSHWHEIESIIRVIRERKNFNTKTKKWEKSHAVHYYISTKKVPWTHFVGQFGHKNFFINHFTLNIIFLLRLPMFF